MASEIRVNKINSLSGVGTVTLSPTGVDIAGITTAATLRATTGIVTSLTAGSLTSLSDVKVGSGVTLSPDGDVSITGVTTFTSHIDASSDVFISDKIIHAGDTNTQIRFPSADTITAETGGTERLRIDSSGRVMIGSGTYIGGAALAVLGTGNTPNTYGSFAIGKVGANPTSGTSLANIRLNGGSVGTGRGAEINAIADANWSDGSSHPTYLTVATVASSSTSATERIRVHAGGNVDIKTGSLVISTAGQGINFSATGDGSGTDSSELLDDYEEGSWTPNIRNEGTTANWNSQTGTYVKIGQQVTVWFNADGGSDPRSGGSSSSLIMTGLPYSQSMFGNPILGVVGANKSSGTGLYSTTGLILNGFGQGGTQVRFGCGGQAINFSISYVAGCLTYTAAS